MAWYLATIVNGFADGPLATGRHVYINRTILNRVRVVGQHDNTAILALDAARKHLRIERRNGEPIRVKDKASDGTVSAKAGRSGTCGGAWQRRQTNEQFNLPIQKTRRRQSHQQASESAAGLRCPCVLNRI